MVNYYCFAMRNGGANQGLFSPFFVSQMRCRPQQTGALLRISLDFMHNGAPGPINDATGAPDLRSGTGGFVTHLALTGANLS